MNPKVGKSLRNVEKPSDTAQKKHHLNIAKHRINSVEVWKFGVPKSNFHVQIQSFNIFNELI